ncbi:Abi family protein [Chitinophaga cymbidii]|uniref:CAAX amino protease n=1 Tax=Chitinophaga cymbidii TaxID=1096750 RepID=A0A512RP65_9BACT|nr:Abi family protein [Chitinophaga cymbidii]GEP97477.1 hypothetical protein CCY01nite_37370 [Chitinophaga cymbidii]
MNFKDFEHNISPARLDRYRIACQGNTQKAMTLYRKNLKVSQKLFTIISCFEVTLRNTINRHCTAALGPDWLRDAALEGGLFDNENCAKTAGTIREVLSSLADRYSHNKLVAGLGLGFWRYLFSRHQYRALGQNLLSLFSSRPQSTAAVKYNAPFIFRQLTRINNIRNRIAHHEPICFLERQPVKDTVYIRQHYACILQLLQWMSIDVDSLFYGLDQVSQVCDEIDAL